MVSKKLAASATPCQSTSSTIAVPMPEAQKQYQEATTINSDANDKAPSTERTQLIQKEKTEKVCLQAFTTGLFEKAVSLGRRKLGCLQGVFQLCWQQPVRLYTCRVYCLLFCLRFVDLYRGLPVRALPALHFSWFQCMACRLECAGRK